MGSTTDLVAVSDFAGNAGGTVWWDLRQTTLETLKPYWLAAGLDPDTLPPPPTPERRLGRAVKVAERLHLSGANLAGVPIKRRGAWQIDARRVTIDGTASVLPNGVDSTPVARAQIDFNGLLVLDDLGTSIGYDVCRAIREAYDDGEGSIEASDVALWLTSAVEVSFAGIRLRRAGGCYYVPPGALASLVAVADVLREAGVGEVSVLPTLPSDAAARAILGALSAEVDSVADDVIDAIGTGNLGARALRSKVLTLDDLAAKLSEYESVLGSALDSVRKRALDAAEAATIAAFAAEAAKETEAAKD